jgi:hypothetical protein
VTDVHWEILAWVLGAGFLGLVIRFAISAMRAAKRPVPGAGAVGWALIFLTSGRMPPPPPESQIEAELNGEKDRGWSEPLRKPPNNSLERGRDR